MKKGERIVRTIQLERSICRGVNVNFWEPNRKLINPDCLKCNMNDDRYIFFSKIQQQISITSSDLYELFPFLLLRFNKEKNPISVLIYYNSYYNRAKFLNELDTKSIKYEMIDANGEIVKSPKAHKNYFVLFQVKGIEDLKELTAKYIIDIACNNYFVGFWIGEGVPCFTLNYSMTLSNHLVNSVIIDTNPSQLFVTFFWDGEGVIAYDKFGNLTEDKLRKLLGEQIKVEQFDEVDFACCN